MTDLELLTRIDEFCSKAEDGRSTVNEISEGSNLSRDEAWGRFNRLKDSKYISIDVGGGVRLLPEGVAYLADLQQQKKSEHKKKGSRVALRIFEWIAGIAAAVIGAFLIYRFGLN